MCRHRLAFVFAFCLVAATALAHPGWGIVRDVQGNTFFTDLKQVWKLAPSGELTVVVPHVHTHELVIDARGNLCGENLAYEAPDKWHDYFWRRSPDGRVTTVIADGGVTRGVSLLKDAAGNEYSVEQNNHTRTRTVLLKRTPAGNVTEVAGGAFGAKDGKGNAAQFGSVGGVAVMPDGSVFLVDGSALRKVATDDTVTTIARGLDQPAKLLHGTGGLANPRSGLRLDPAGNAYIADFDNRRALKITPNGARVTAYESPLGWGPTGIWIEGEDLYVLEGRHPFGDGVRVVRARGGKGTVLAKVD
ncbi:MAG: hypothetical protein HYX28_08675 [Candidatus Koribacter versatilis]|uniref:NHL repeat protein n=1 Tax=Candidatus Korobacter versatilis TaxID=658062 RepID=A0A932A8Y7_9BACT|nr:hypothetical protein [Candidatus Koribacter versatilis]